VGIYGKAWLEGIALSLLVDAYTARPHEFSQSRTDLRPRGRPGVAEASVTSSAPPAMLGKVGASLRL